jgi:bacillithiol biosynthesis cysteine-adding enzyme BshC
MQVVKVLFDQINALAFKDKFYQLNHDQLSQFISFTPDLEGLKQAVEKRKKEFPVDRELLYSVLADHYSNIDATVDQRKNLEKLKNENTFTVVTAHQPCLLGGPAYYFYKVFSTINLCHQLNKKWPDFHFVPVFVIGSEDHDFDEVKSLHLFGKTVEWASTESGPVGKFSVNGLREVLDHVGQLLGNSPQRDFLNKIFTDALAASFDYNGFVFRWINALLGATGLIVVNMDDLRLKKAFSPIMEREITQRESIHLVQNTQESLSAFGFRPQAFARDINIFWMEKGIRERIIWENNHYRVHNTDMKFTTEKMVRMLEHHPENFSPNVVMRPMYQEYILPNIAYIGGGGEIAYWLERKAQFEHFGVFFPALIRRNSIGTISKTMQKSMLKLDIGLQDLLLDEQGLINLYIHRASNSDFHLSTEAKQIFELFEKISNQAKSIDPTLGPFVLSEGHKVVKNIESIESRLKKTVKQKEEITINQLKNLRSKLFPDHGLQERKESFLPMYISEGMDIQNALIALCDPLQKEFLFIYL